MICRRKSLSLHDFRDFCWKRMNVKAKNVIPCNSLGNKMKLLWKHIFKCNLCLFIFLLHSSLLIVKNFVFFPFNYLCVFKLFLPLLSEKLKWRETRNISLSKYQSIKLYGKQEYLYFQFKLLNKYNKWKSKYKNLLFLIFFLPFPPWKMQTA